ncbi:Lrp/AsnC family transcriptional regulator [Amycolatopsis jejuensis]|uniref:Lrp/AsnC family transcriptional regulator n=1 Tax=Amycolatopsis jejuensis TaxID=330084 RepID=UPI000527BD0A|nr:Lrp/AsnC family transcriptional regulator [Amycolatopsis jejuensis]
MSSADGLIPAGWWEHASLDARLAAALQANPRVSWRDLAKAVGSSESTVARRVRALTTSGALRTTVVVDSIRTGRGFPVTVYFAVTNKSLRTLAEHLVARDDVRMVAVLTGRYTLLAEFITASTEDLATILLDALAGVDATFESMSEPVLREFKSTVDWSHSLVADIPDVRLPLVDLVPEEEPAPLDPVEEAIAELLRVDGRMSFADLAQATDLSESAVRRRTDALIAAGRVHPVTLVDARLLGFHIQSFVWVDLDPATLDDAVRTLAARQEVRYVAATAGDSDLLVELIVPTQGDLFRFRTEVLGTLPGVRGTRLSINLRTLKRAFLPLEDPGQAGE